MKQVLATLLLLLLMLAVHATNISRSGTPISAAEYFIDVDPGFGNGQSIPITGGWNVSMDFSVSTTGLRNGTHRLYVRTQNSDGTWGIPQSKMFIVQDKTQADPTPTLTQAEYYIDSISGTPVHTAIISSGITASLDASIPTTGLRNGTHRLYVRTQNSDGTWGIPQSKMFIVQDKTQADPTPTITQAEYYIDSISGTPVHTALISSGITASLDVSIPTTGLRNGTHRLYVRTQNSDGTWGIPQSKMFFVQDNGPSEAAPSLTQAEYYIDSISGTPVHTATISSGITASLDVSIPTTGLRNGTHWLFVRTQNSDGTWGIPQSKMFIVQDRAPNEAAPNIVAVKWYLDQNSSAAVTQAVSSPSTNITEVLDIPIEGLSMGTHNVRIQAMNSDNVWGIPQSLNFDFVPINTPPVIDMPPSIAINQNESIQINMASYVSDADNDQLYISVPNHDNINVTVNGLVVTLSPRPNWTGIEQLTFVVNDYNYTPTRDAASDDVSIIVTNPLLVDFSTDSQLNNNVVAGDAQTAIGFSATSNLPLTSFAWDFDNNGTTDSILPNPSYTYPDSGLVSVKLTASDGVHVTTVIKQDYIHVHPGVVVPPAVVNQNIVWTEQGGPYNLTGEVLLNPGYSLTIEPNAQVNMLVDNHLVINGSINATEANFTAFGENGWGGIVLGSTATNSVINGINVVGAATGITINDCNPVLTGITLVAAEAQRTPTQAIVINGASAPLISNLNINNFAYGIKANNPGTTPVNLNINSLRVNRGTSTPASGDTAFEINGNYIVDISSTVVTDYPFGIKIDSTNRSRARARLANTRVIKTESNNRDNSIAFSLANLSHVEIVRDSLIGFNTGILINNPGSPCNITMQNCSIRRELSQLGSEVGIKLLGSSSGTIDSTFVYNYNRAMDFSGNHALQITNNKFVDCSTVLSESQNHSPHSLVRNLAYRSSIFTGAVQLPIFSIDAGTNFTAKNNTFHAFPSYVSATNASSLVFNQNIIWSPNPGSTPISLSGGSTLNASYCDIALAQGVQPGTGNLNTNPLFMNPAQGIFALNVYSPCIDAGNPANPHDPDGSIADMGAFTFNWATAPLIADFFVDTSSGQHPLTVHFTDHSTRNTISREWDFNADNITDSTEQNPVWTYTATGTYSVKLRVFDGVRYDTKLLSNLIQALNTPPQITQTIPSLNIPEDSPGSIIELANYFHDANNDPLSFSFTQSNQVVNASLNGSQLSISTIPNINGSCQITVSALEISRTTGRASSRQRESADGNRESSRVSQSFTITVQAVNDAPTISLPSSFTFAEDANLVVNMASLVSDVDSPNLTITAQNSAHVSVAMNGLVATLTSAANWFGTESLSFTVSDGSLTASASTNVIVTPVNDPPTISLPASFTFAEDGSLSINMANYASDVDSATLTLTASGNTHVSVSINGMMVSLGAEADWSGTEAITFTVNDNVSRDCLTERATDNGQSRLIASATTNIIVSPVNEAPSITLPSSFTFAEDANLVVNMASLVSDVDSPNLTITAQNSAHVSVTMNGLVATLTTTANWFGTENLNFTVSDGSLTASASTNVIVTPVNDPPTMSLPSSYTFAEDANLVVNMASLVDDVDSSNLTITAQNSAHVSVTMNGLVATLTTTANWFGTENLSFTVSDGSLTASASTSVEVTTENDAPSISLLPLYQFMEDETLMLDLSDCISDVDSQDLSLAVSGNGFTHCTVDGYTLLFSADPNWFGSEQLTVTVSDSRTRLSSSTITTILVEPVNDPPQIVSYNPATSEIEALANSSVSFTVEATDIDSQLSYHWFVNGEELSDSSSSCSYFFSQSGTYAVSVKVADEGVELMHEWSVLVPVGVDDPELCPTTTQLYPIYPNPFSEQSTISFSLKEAAYTTIQVYNAKGQLIKTLCDSQQTAAQHKLCWDGKDDSGQSVASGVYYVRMQCFGDLYMVKALLIK